MDVAWFQSRYDKVGPGGTGADYINCPLDRDQYLAFIDGLVAAEKAEFHDWEKDTPYFDGCLPIEVMAERGRRNAPARTDEADGPHEPAQADEKSYAVVQLRQDNALGTLFNMVGFQTKMKHGEQVRLFRTIPGAGEGGVRAARRAASQHVPELAAPARRDAAPQSPPHIRFAGQITGCEGYVESAAVGLMAARFAAAETRGDTRKASAADDGARGAARAYHGPACGAGREARATFSR